MLFQYVKHLAGYHFTRANHWLLNLLIFIIKTRKIDTNEENYLTYSIRSLTIRVSAKDFLSDVNHLLVTARIPVGKCHLTRLLFPSIPVFAIKRVALGTRLPLEPDTLKYLSTAIYKFRHNFTYQPTWIIHNFGEKYILSQPLADKLSLQWLIKRSFAIILE